MVKSINLQALRGISVVLVVLFHIGAPFFTNGWIGVDIFFVISGFLMWHLYADKISEGQLREFYVKRLKRLLPALSVLILSSSLIFYFILLPNERHLFINEIFSASFAFSNLYYWAEVQYFSSSQLRPLLNLWSIALELQFYLIFPILVILLKKSTLRFISILLLSVATFIGLGLYSFQTSFFTLPGRLWEFLLGMFVAHLKPRQIRESKRFWMFKYFLVAVVILSTLVPKDDKFKMLVQIAIAFFSALYIMLGFNGISTGVLVRSLSKIGDYSYSIYLIHFPLFILLGYTEFGGNPIKFESIFSAVLFFPVLILASWLMKEFVEDSKFLRKNFLKISFVTLFLATTMLASKDELIKFGYSDDEINIASATLDRGEFRCGLLARFPILNSPSRTCLISSAGDTESKVLLVGNSHADSIKEAVVTALPGKQVFLLNQNDPIREDTYNSYITGVTELKPETVILHNSSGSVEPYYLRKFVADLSIIGIRVVIIEPVPSLDLNVPKFAWSLKKAGIDLSKFAKEGFDLETYYASKTKELSLLTSLSINHGVTLIPVADLFCDPSCQIVDKVSLKPLYFDGSHLTLTGAGFVVDRLKSGLEGQASNN
jgi:peptidoglycan/LPS O-acetylase OafA/YrhL